MDILIAGRFSSNQLVVTLLVYIGLTFPYIQDVEAETWLPPVSETGSAEKIDKEKFRKEVAKAHIKWHENRGVVFTPTLDNEVIEVLSTNTTVKLKPEASRSLKKLIVQARADLAEDKSKYHECALATTGVFLQSGYRDYEQEKRLWKGAFEKRYTNTKTYRSKLEDKHGKKAIDYVLRRLRAAKAYPGFSSHSKGLSIDFATTVKYKKTFRLGPNTDHKKAWKNDTWLYPWLQIHAGEFDFVPYNREPWHWSYNPSASVRQAVTAGPSISCNVYGNKTGNKKKSSITKKANKESTKAKNITVSTKNKNNKANGRADDVTQSSKLRRVSDGSNLGKICFNFGGKKVYALDVPNNSDLWLARMIHGETGGKPVEADASYMLWTTVQRWYLRGGFLKDGSTRKDLVAVNRNHSQPVNARWTREGDKCSRFYKTGKYVNNNSRRAEACAPNKVKRRARYQSLKWEEISPVARSAVYAFFSGELDNPVAGAVGWAANGLWKRQQKSGDNKKEKKVKVASVSKNTYYSLTRSKGRELSSEETEITVITSGSNLQCGQKSDPIPKQKKSSNKQKSGGLKNPF